jgi:hypothetical protein
MSCCESACWKVMLAPMSDNVVISEVDALMYVVLSEVEIHVPYGKLCGTRKCLTLYLRRHINRGRYIQVQLYMLFLLYFTVLRGRLVSSLWLRIFNYFIMQAFIYATASNFTLKCVCKGFQICAAGSNRLHQYLVYYCMSILLSL